MWVPKDFDEYYRTSDVAILELVADLPSTSRPITLATPATKVPKSVIVAGWGNNADYEGPVSKFENIHLSLRPYAVITLWVN